MNRLLTLLLLASYLGLYHAVFAWLGARLWRRRNGLALLGLPALWVVLEVVRSHVATGFPWNLAGYSAAGLPGATDSTSTARSWTSWWKRIMRRPNGRRRAAIPK